MMSDKNKNRKRMTEFDKDADNNWFAYRPPNLKAKPQKDTEEKGYVPPKKPRRPSGSDSKKSNKKS